MSKKILKLTPDQLGYKDRGKMKWQGLMLSDHTEALKKRKTEDTVAEPMMKERMSETELSKILLASYVNKLPIILQANTLNNGLYTHCLECRVLGYQDDKIFLLLKDGRQVSCELYQIRNISYMDPLDWYGKMENSSAN